MSGNAQQMQQKMQAEIDELKKQLQERTGQLEVASNTIIERNEEISRLRDQNQDLNAKHDEQVAQLEARIKELEEALEAEKNNLEKGNAKLMEEIRQLKKDIGELKERSRKEYQELQEKLTKQKE